MRKSLYILSLVTLASCASDEYLGAPTVEEGAISFGGNTTAMHRAAGSTGAEAAERLDNRFVVFGTKMTGTGRQTVFDHYSVGYNADGILGSATNTAGWEYVGLTFSNASNLYREDADNMQTVKYWDYGASQYDFVAFSTGLSTLVRNEEDIAPGRIRVTPVDAENLTTAAFTLRGDLDDIAAAYLAPRVTVRDGATPIDGRMTRPGQPVTFHFAPLGARLRFGLYETIPGYSVTDVTFYAADSEDPANPNPTTAHNPILYTASHDIAAGRGTMTVAFPETDPAKADFNKPVTSFTADDPSAVHKRDITFGALSTTSAERLESNLTPYICRSLTGASLTDYATIPPTDLDDALCLKMDFTLVSYDGFGETIRIHGAKAIVPATYTHWQLGYAYTYIFKLSSIVSDEHGNLLCPIQLDAVRTEDWQGSELEEQPLEN